MREGKRLVRVREAVRWNKGPPSLAITEHWNYEDRKDFFGGYLHMSQGPLAVQWASAQTGARGLWRQALAGEMAKYNHMLGLKMVGEMMPQERNMVTLADEYGLMATRVTCNWNDNKAMVKHSPDFMSPQLEATDPKNVWRLEDGTDHLAGTARVGNNRYASVVNADCRSWDGPNLFICDGSAFPITEGVNPLLTIQALAKRGEL